MTPTPGPPADSFAGEPVRFNGSPVAKSGRQGWGGTRWVVPPEADSDEFTRQMSGGSSRHEHQQRPGRRGHEQEHD